MIINKQGQILNPILKPNTLKAWELGTHDTKNYLTGLENIEKRKSMSLLNSKKIKSRLSEILQDDGLRKSDTNFFDLNKTKKQKSVREYFHKTFMKKKEKQGEKSHTIGKEKMEIIGFDDQKIRSSHTPSFKVKEVKLRRKGSPYLQQSQFYKGINNDHKYQDRYSRVLALAKTRFNHDKLFTRKPQIPEEHKVKESQKVSDNFLRPRHHKQKGQAIEGFDILEPWDKSEEYQNGGFDY